MSIQPDLPSHKAQRDLVHRRDCDALLGLQDPLRRLLFGLSRPQLVGRQLNAIASTQVRQEADHLDHSEFCPNARSRTS